MIGIRFEIPNDWGNHLKAIFGDVNTSGFNWLVTDEEIYLKGFVELFNKKHYGNAEFEKIISDNEYYLISGNIAAFKSKKYKDIYSYQDFLHSDCEILMVIVDSVFIDLYVKDYNILQKINDNAYKNNFKNIKFICDITDKRNIFHI